MTTTDTPADGAPAIVELRQYTLRPGQRDALIELFDAELVEPQEHAGMSVLGQFRDLDDPDRFVWLRGFADMGSRARALESFYRGPVWAAHREAANATMLDCDDVLLLRPALQADVPARRLSAVRPAAAEAAAASLVTATIYAFTSPPGHELVGVVAGDRAALEADVDALGTPLLETEPAENTWPALPVREGEHVVVRLERFDDDDARAARRDAERRSGERDSRLRRLAGHLSAPPQELRLRPTSRSLLR